MKAFVFLFPPGLALALAIGFGAMGVGSWWHSAAWVAPWLLISPWMAGAIERKTIQAVDRLVSGMAGAKRRA